jgi:hypothetical protein
MPEPRHLYGPLGFIDTVNNQVLAMNNSANPTVTPKAVVSSGQLNQCKSLVNQPSHKPFRSRRVIPLHVGLNLVQVGFCPP